MSHMCRQCAGSELEPGDQCHACGHVDEARPDEIIASLRQQIESLLLAQAGATLAKRALCDEADKKWVEAEAWKAQVVALEAASKADCAVIKQLRAENRELRRRLGEAEDE